MRKRSHPVVEHGAVAHARPLSTLESTLLHAADARTREVGLRSVDAHLGVGPARPFSPDQEGQVSENFLDPMPAGAEEPQVRAGHLTLEIDGKRTGRTRNDAVRSSGRAEALRDVRALEQAAIDAARDLRNAEERRAWTILEGAALGACDLSEVKPLVDMITTVNKQARRDEKRAKRELPMAEARIVRYARTAQPIPNYFTHAVMTRSPELREVFRGTLAQCKAQLAAGRYLRKL